MQVGVLLKQRPIQPIGFVVVAVSVVVAVLRAPDLISHQNHGKPEREQRNGHEILHLTVPEPFDFDIRGWSLDATVPAPIVIATVTVLLTICLIVLLVVGDQVAERKPIVTGNKVHALFRFPFFMPVHLMTAEESVGEMPQRSFVSTEKIPYIIPKATVPFFPAVANEAAHLVKTGGVPRFCDQLGPREGWIGLNIPKHRRVGHDIAVGIASEDRSQIEAESVHVHLLDPIPKAVQDQAPNDGMVGIQRVSCPAVIGIARPVRLQKVVSVVVEATKA